MAEKKRCAIYTRKSTEEGLEQDFNSLDAQREACAAYILSQAHEGWEQVSEHYDDGGWSGGSMDRPALRQLLADVAANRVDIIVVYKVDRLTRSLADFAKIVEILDGNEASFVSVTQAFNTTNSMGRLTLNVLLSFAQFEREVTGERIRDKIAASKKKGMWMGGPVPIGYRLEARKLLVDPEEAATVAMIFERYCELRSIPRLVDELAVKGVRTKRRVYRTGRVVGGIPFETGAIAHLIKNPIYAGKAHHDGKLFEGQHEAIIEPERWEEAQAILQSNRHHRQLGAKSNNPSLLTGLLVDPDGRPMTPTHACRGQKRYRYYVSRLQPGDDRSELWRIPAGKLEAVALRLVEQWLRKFAAAGDVSVAQGVTQQIDDLQAKTMRGQRRVILEHRLTFRLSPSAIRIIGLDGNENHQISLPVNILMQGKPSTLAMAPDDQAVADPDPVLLRLLAQADAAQHAAIKGTPEPSVAHYSKAHQARLLRISWLAPDIVSRILDGRQPDGLTGRRLLRAANLPLDWREQGAFLGFS